MSHQIFIERLNDAFDILMSELQIDLYKNNITYAKLSDEIKELKNIYPKLNDIYEFKNVNNLEQKEVESLISIIDNEQELKHIELKKIFTLGIKEAYYIFKELDLFKKEDTD